MISIVCVLVADHDIYCVLVADHDIYCVLGQTIRVQSVSVTNSPAHSHTQLYIYSTFHVP